MPFLRSKSVKTRIILPLIGMGLILSLVGLFILLSLVQSTFEQAAKNEAEAVAGSLLLTAESHRGLPGLQRFTTSLAADPRIHLIVIVSGEPAQVIACSRLDWLGLPLGQLPLLHVRDDLEQVLQSRKPHFGIHSDTKEYDATLPAMLFSGSSDRLSPSAIMVHVDYQETSKAYIKTYSIIALLLVGLILLFTVGIYVLLEQRVLSRLTMLRQGISNSNNQAQLISIKSQANDEIDDLIHAYNNLVIRLEDEARKLSNTTKEKKLLAKVSEKTSNSIIVCNAEGRIYWANEGFTRLTGYQLNEVLGKKPGSFLQGPLTDQHEVAKIRNAITQKMSVTAELINYHRDGGHYWIRMTIEPIYNDVGTLEHFIAIQSNISEEKEREKALLAAKESAEAHNKAKSEFLATMSHEIRTPLNGIVGMTDILIHSDLSDDQREYATTANTCGHTLLALINDILDFSKIEAGRFSLESIPFNLEEIIRQAFSITQEQAKTKGLSYNFNIENSVPVNLIGDPTRLSQILLNLSSNAIKFTHQGTIDWQVSMKRQHENVAWLQLSIIDSGIGISPDVVDQLFEPFIQAEASTTRQFGGTGLGLAVCKRICEAMGGSIKVESTPGKGSTFTATLPFQIDDISHPTRQSEQPTPKAASNPNASKPPAHKILLTEDNQINQRVMTIMLSNLNCEVELAEDGQQAVEKVKTGQYDIVLMDCQMPVMDGYQATREIRAYEQATNSKRNIIIALTANAMRQSRQECLDAGMDDFLTKPLSIQTLKKILEKHLV